MKRTAKSIISILLAACVFFSSTIYAYPEEKTVEQRVEEILAQMTLKEKISQMILYDVPAKGKKVQKKYQFGGYLLFADSFENSTPANVKKRIRSWQKVSKVKMLIAVDEEGGSITRVSKFKQFRSSPFPSPSELRKKGGIPAVKADTTEKAIFLKSLGINTDLAPVCDTPYKAKDYIAKRTYSTNANMNSQFVKTAVTEFNARGCVSCLKHFPGYGGNGNTHTDIIRDKRKRSVYETRDLLPFKAGIDAGAPMILVNHDIIRAFDKKNPASISKKVHKYLRKQMGYEGVIMTDSLNMTAAKNFVGNDKKLAVKAVQAGNDMLCTGNGITAINAIYKAVKKGKIKEKQIDNSVRRILRMKIKYGIIK